MCVYIASQGQLREKGRKLLGEHGGNTVGTLSMTILNLCPPATILKFSVVSDLGKANYIIKLIPSLPGLKGQGRVGSSWELLTEGGPSFVHV